MKIFKVPNRFGELREWGVSRTPTGARLYTPAGKIFPIDSPSQIAPPLRAEIKKELHNILQDSPELRYSKYLRELEQQLQKLNKGAAYDSLGNPAYRIQDEGPLDAAPEKS
jgi:hypothetical protein